jgi:hypothetical protein
MPVRANQTNQLVAFVDGNEIILGRVRASAMPNPVDKQGGDVRLHTAQYGIGFNDVRPRVQSQ